VYGIYCNFGGGVGGPEKYTFNDLGSYLKFNGSDYAEICS